MARHSGPKGPDTPCFVGRAWEISATFTWNGTQSGTSLSSAGTVGGYGGICLDDTNWATSPGTQLQIWDCTGAANQQWSLPAG